jgi:NAD(P)-dependent dehydrogenase (short-subunit alcohol dehydrogenase family)
MIDGAKVVDEAGVTFIHADVAVETDGEGAISQPADTKGRLDMLVANAGGPAPTMPSRVMRGPRARQFSLLRKTNFCAMVTKP